MKALRTAVFWLALSLASSLSLADERKLDIAATEYPPYYGKDLEDNGFITEIIREAFKRGGYEAEIKFLPWKRALQGTKRGNHDGLFTVWYRPEREEWFVYSDPLPANELRFFKRKDKDISFKNYDDLKPYTIGVVRGYAAPPGFEEAGLKTDLANDDEQNLRKLHKRHVDLVLADRIVAEYIISSELPEAASDLEWLEPPVHVDKQYLVISRKAPNCDAILTGFNEGLTAMQADGTLKAIMAKHGF